MTDYKTLSDSELTEALNFHRRQRNMSRGINEAAHMRQTQVVRLLEAEEARRLNEEKPNHYIVSKRKNGEYGVSQDVGNNVWDHSYHHGTHKTVDAAKAWAVKHAGKYPHKIEVHEEVELDEAVSVDKKNYSWGKLITVRHGSSHSFPLHPEHQEKIKNLKDGESTAFRDETGSHVTAHREGDKVHLKLRGANQKTTVAHSHFTEEVNQIDELSKATLKSYVSKKANQIIDKDEKSNPYGVNGGGSSKERNKDFNKLNLARKKVAEEAEQIDELSKKTLGSYVRRSAVDLYRTGQNVEAHMNARNATGNYAAQRRHAELTDKARLKASNRISGIERATKKMAKEEVEQLDELSPKTLHSYIKKADKHMDKLDRTIRKSDDTIRQADMARHKLGGAARKADDAQSEKSRRAADTEYGRAQRKVGTTSSAADEARKTKSAAQRKMDKRYAGVEKAYSRLGEEVEQIDEISVDLKKRYVEKGAEDVVDRFTGRGKYEKPRNPAHFTKTGRVKKSALNRPEAIKYREKLDNRRDIVNKVSQEVHGKKRFGEEVEIDEAASYRDRGYANMLKADRKAEKELAKLRAQQAKDATKKASKPEEFKEESNLRITKVYNKWPKPATYAVHNADRSYHKEFDSMEAAQAHKAEKSK